jgi:hypothetical protein
MGDLRVQQHGQQKLGQLRHDQRRLGLQLCEQLRQVIHIRNQQHTLGQQLGQLQHKQHLWQPSVQLWQQQQMGYLLE